MRTCDNKWSERSIKKKKKKKKKPHALSLRNFMTEKKKKKKKKKNAQSGWNAILKIKQNKDFTKYIKSLFFKKSITLRIAHHCITDVVRSYRCVFINIKTFIYLFIEVRAKPQL